jgi:hypothetical protein
MSYIVGKVDPDEDGFGFNVAAENNPRPIVSFSFEDFNTAKAMATKMNEIVEVCVRLKAH